MREVDKPALRYHGAKFRLAPWVMSFFPPHRIYTEAFGGAAGVLLQKPRCYAEVYNDLDGEVVNFFRVVRDEGLRARLVEQLELTPYARDEFVAAVSRVDDPVESARRLCIRAQMGFGASGATKDDNGFRIDLKRDYGTAMSGWAKYPAGLRAAGERFAGVLIENRPACQVIAQHDGPDVLHFVDPPYVHDTRKMGWSATYRHEMDDAAHGELIAQLRSLAGMVVLSGYPSGLYADMLGDWTMHTTTARISAGRGAAVRTEAVWLNPACVAALQGDAGLPRVEQMALFGVDA